MNLSLRMLGSRRSRFVAATAAIAIAATVMAGAPALAKEPATFPKPVFDNPVEGASATVVPEFEAPATSTSAKSPPIPRLKSETYLLDLPRAAQEPADDLGAQAFTSAPVGDTGITASESKSSTAAGKTGRAVPKTEVSIAVLDADEVTKLGLTGLALEIKKPSDDSETTIEVQIPKNLLNGLYGADYAGRLRWQTIEAASPSARRATGLDLADNSSRRTAADSTLTEDNVSVRLVASSTSRILTAAASPVSSSGTGSFAATPLKPSSTWDISAQTGSFAWDLPITVPPAAAGPAPEIALSYASQAVDGETSSTNNQPSAIGDGWELSGAGFIERTYVACAADDGASGAITTSGDQCWKTENATLSFAGQSGALIRDVATGVWKLQNDDGSRVEQLFGSAQGCAANGTYNSECWRLTGTDGTQYYFGLGQLPGWSAGKPVTQSTWTVPVYGNDPSEPCHASTFAGSSCVQAWRWNLDYIVDVHGNAEAFYYNAETNRYAAAGGPAATYTRGGQIDHIDYGLKSTAIYAPNAASGRVVFGYDSAGRCSDPVRTNCTSQPSNGLAATPANPARYPDVPFDQNCPATACTGMLAPTYWTIAQLNTITTQSLKAGVYENVDRWSMDHSFPDPGDGTPAALWMTQVTHTGYSGTITLAEAPTIFAGTALQNRVWPYDGLAPLDKYRISSVRLSTGAVISVNYSPQECTPSQTAAILASLHTNTRRCFPQWWSPDVVTTQPAQLDLFHKYVVTSTVTNPMTGGGMDPAIETYYDYSEGTPAWRYETSPFVPAAKRSWSVYAGYNKVTIRVGEPTSPTTQETTSYVFYQGMDGDRAAPSGGSKSVSVAGEPGVTDSLWLAGRTRQATIRNGAAGAMISSTTTVPWVGAGISNDGTRVSRVIRDGETIVTEAVSTGGTRTTRAVTTYDAAGFALTQSQQDSQGGTSFCVTNTYTPPNTTSWILGSLQQATKIAKACDQASNAVFPADSVSATRYAYDGQAVGAAPSKGNVTTTLAVDSFAGSTFASAHWSVTGTAEFDAIGRPTSKTDALGRTKTTAYTPAATAAAGSGALRATTTTDPAPFSWTTTSIFDPSRGQPVSVADVNGKVTQIVYDPLGRTTKVWLSDRPKETYPTSPSVSYAYTTSTTSASSIATTTLAPANNMTTYELFDGLGTSIQTQSPAEGGGTIVTDRGFDTAGREVLTNSAYWTAAVTPSGALFVPTSQSQIPSSTITAYDGIGRALSNALVGTGVERFRTTYSYPGADRTDMTPPSGGTPTTSYTNALGQTTRLIQYIASTPSQGATQITTDYTFDGQGHMSGMHDAAGNSWTWTYDALGRNTLSIDPDTGTTTRTYDLIGNLTSSTDGRGITLAYAYDGLGRKLTQREGSSTGPLLAKWTYDTLAKGQLTSSSTFVGSTTATPGIEYKSSIDSYDAGYRATSTTVSIPVGAPRFGGTTYSEQISFYQDGSPNLRKLPAVGGLPAESLRATYGANGRLGGLRSSATTYLSGVTYTPIGQAAQYDRSGTTSHSTSIGYDAVTGTVSQVEDTLLSGTNFTAASTRTYVRNNAGDITSTSATGANAAADTQCYAYDNLQNLTSVWTPSSNSCAAAPSTTGLGGPAPFWSTYLIDPVTGNRTQSVDNPVTASAAATTYNYTYPAAGSPRPHAVSTVVKQGGSSAPVTSTFASDNSGNTTMRPGQTLEYDATGKVKTITTGTASQNNVYDPSGNLLLRVDSTTGGTLYLGDTELSQTTSAAPVKGTRTYTANGMTIAERTGTAGTTTTTLNWLSSDLLNTALMEINALTGAIVRRYADPFGKPRGTAAPWSSNHGFLNAPTSVLSGLTHLGAREYDPELGRFLTVDIVLAPANPQQNNGYSYAGNNPVNRADPSGNCMTGDDYTCGAGTRGRNVSKAQAASPTSAAPAAAGSVKTQKSTSPSNRKTATVQTAQQKEDKFDGAALAQDFFAIAAGVVVTVVVIAAAAACVAATVGLCAVAGAGFMVASVGVAGAAGGLATYHYSSGEKNGNGYFQSGAIGSFTGVFGPVVMKAGSAAVKLATTRAGAAASSTEARAVSDAISSACSFVGNTLVLMADGTKKAISNIGVGDKVMAADALTGTSSVETVTHLWAHDDLMSELSTSGGTVVTTEDHPFWNATDHAWQRADELDVGDSLLGASGNDVTVTASIDERQSSGTAYNLTVEDVHTYFVFIGQDPVLVHNTCGGGYTELNVTFKAPRRVAPASDDESFLLNSVRQSPGYGDQIMDNLSDPRFPAADGWVKMERRFGSARVHWLANPLTKEAADFKFK
jgi:RHS repeat-associated protein